MTAIRSFPRSRFRPTAILSSRSRYFAISVWRRRSACDLRMVSCRLGLTGGRLRHTKANNISFPPANDDLVHWAGNDMQLFVPTSGNPASCWPRSVRAPATVPPPARPRNASPAIAGRRFRLVGISHGRASPG